MTIQQKNLKLLMISYFTLKVKCMEQSNFFAENLMLDQEPLRAELRI